MRQTRKPPRPHHLTARAVTKFLPNTESPLSVRVVDYGVVITAEITAASPTIIESVVVDDGLCLILAVGDGGIFFSLIDWPRMLDAGESLSVAIRVPVAAVENWRFCHAELPEIIAVSTKAGSYVFRH